MLYIDETKCPQSHRCPMVPQCPVEAISQNGYGLPAIDHEICIECGKCIEICGMHAVYKE